jgi:hypothetical protein
MPRLPAWSNRATSAGVVAVPLAETPNTNAPPLFAAAFGFKPQIAADRSKPPKVLTRRKSMRAMLLAADALPLLMVAAVVAVPKVPRTSNRLAGELVPMPRLPLLSSVARSDAAVPALV